MLSEIQADLTRWSHTTTPEASTGESALVGPQKLSFQEEMGRISRQSGIVFAGTIFTEVFGYVFKVCLARVLGAEALGIYAPGMTIVGLRGILNGLGAAGFRGAVCGSVCSLEKIRSAARAVVEWFLMLLAANLIFAAKRAARDTERGTPLSWELVSRP